MKQHDTSPPLRYLARYNDPAAGELDIPPGTTVVLIMTPHGATTPTIDREAAEITDSTDGIVTIEYQWQTGDTDTPGRYRIEFEVNLNPGKLTIPTYGHLDLLIEPDLG